MLGNRNLDWMDTQRIIERGVWDRLDLDFNGAIGIDGTDIPKSAGWLLEMHI